VEGMKRLRNIISKEQVQEFLDQLGVELYEEVKGQPVRAIKKENRIYNVGMTADYCIIHNLNRILQDT
jgi:hypothetical protein